MKANEFMIGDWVEYRFTGWTEKGGVYKNYQYVRISTIGRMYVKADHDRVASADGEEFFPISLTPEILEKNGFEYNEHPFVQGWEQFGLTLYHGGDGYRVNCGQNIALQLDFVHQLQHALRLCGIEKEIEL